MAPRIAPQSVTALRTIASNTGWTSVGELEITRRISLVAVCCSSASPSDRLRLSTSVFGCACEPVVRSGPLKGFAQCSQNLAVGRFSCWHRGHCISKPPNHRAGEHPNSRARVALRLPHGQGRCGEGPRVCSFARDGGGGWRRTHGKPTRARSWKRRIQPWGAYGVPRQSSTRLRSSSHYLVVAVIEVPPTSEAARSRHCL